MTSVCVHDVKSVSLSGVKDNETPISGKYQAVHLTVQHAEGVFELTLFSSEIGLLERLYIDEIGTVNLADAMNGG